MAAMAEARDAEHERTTRATGDDMTHVFEHDPDLLAGLDASAADFLRRRVAVHRIWVEPGAWTPPQIARDRAPLGLLVLDGLMVRTVALDDRRSPELVGAGDLLRPWDARDDEALIAHRTTWSALERTTLAVLDDRFVSVASRCPAVLTTLLTRSVHRAHAMALSRTISSIRHAETRLQLVLWHLADRWGRVTPQGVHLPLTLTHELLAHLSGMRRPTASSALQRLVRSGELARRDDGTWMLLGDPPSVAAHADAAVPERSSGGASRGR